jgi:hypothetical protein
MKAGQLALLRFPRSNLDEGKLRPVLLLARLKGDYPDWLVAMVSGRLQQAIQGRNTPQKSSLLIRQTKGAQTFAPQLATKF